MQKILAWLDRLSLQQRFEWMGLLVVLPFGIAMTWKGALFWGGLTLLACAAMVAALLMSRNPLLDFSGRVLSAVIPGTINLAFMTHAPDYAAMWSFPMVVYLYFQLGPSLAVLLNVLFLTTAALLMNGAYTSDVLLRFVAAHVLIALFSLAFAVDRRRSEQALRAQASHDELTGLPNRREVLSQLRDWMERSQRYGIDGVMLFVDVDDFKQVNDRHGHEIGDRVLQELAVILKSRIRVTDVIGRLGGEEFLILLGHTQIDEAIRVAEVLQQRCRDGRFSHQQPLALSLGIAKFQVGESLERWISRADLAMYSAKKAGGARWHLHHAADQPASGTEQLH